MNRGFRRKRGGDEDGVVLLGLIKDLALSYIKEQVPAAAALSTKQDVLRHMNTSVSRIKGEKLFAIYLNSRNEILGTAILHDGAVSRETVKPKHAIEEAFRHKGQGVIFVHRHGHAGAAPTEQETRLIKALWSAACAVDLIVHDYLILSRLSIYSALESGLISTGANHHSRAASQLIENFLLKNT